MASNYRVVGRCVCFDDYLYVKEKTSKENIEYYRCRRWRVNNGACQARAIKRSNIMYEAGLEHNHESDTVDIVKMSASEELKCAVRNGPTRAIKRTYNDVITGNRRSLSTSLDQSFLSLALPSFSSKRSTMFREKSKQIPRDPTTLENISLEGEISLYYDTPFVLINDGEVERILVFGTTDFFRRMCKCKELFMDGTFHVAPKLFCQLYTVHGVANGKMIPFIYALLPNKNTSTYCRLLRCLQAVADGEGIVFNPKLIQIDFEIAMKSAINQVFPETAVRGCLFHYRKAIWKKVKSLKINLKIEENIKMVKRFAALPFLKLEDISDVYLKIVEVISDDANITSFVDYMVKTWLEDDDCGRFVALFPREMWNHHNVFALRTNNHLEGWHNGLKKVFKTHPNLFEFIQGIKNDQDTSENKLLIPDGPGIDANGNPISSNSKYRKMNKAMESLTALYNLGSKSPMEFLDEIKYVSMLNGEIINYG